MLPRPRSILLHLLLLSCIRADISDIDVFNVDAPETATDGCIYESDGGDQATLLQTRIGLNQRQGQREDISASAHVSEDLPEASPRSPSEDAVLNSHQDVQTNLFFFALGTILMAALVMFCRDPFYSLYHFILQRSSMAKMDKSFLYSPPSIDCDQSLVEAGGGILRLVNQHAMEHPDKVALVDGRDGSCATYGELVYHATSLSRTLTEAGIGKQDVVALYLPSGPELVVATLAVNNAGAAWVALDADMPRSRNQELQKDSGVRLALVSVWGASPDTGDVPMWIVDNFGTIQVEGALPRPLPRSLPSRPLSRQKGPGAVPPGTTNIVYTCNSSGRPKGVLWGMKIWFKETMLMQERAVMDSATMLLMKCPSHLAPIAYELFPALVSGGTMYCDPHSFKDADLLARILYEQPISVMLATPATMRELAEDIWLDCPDLLEGTSRHLGHVFNAGSSLPLHCCASFQSVLPGVQIHNLHSQPETSTVWWTYGTCPDVALNAPSGIPCPGAGVYLMDAKMSLVPIGKQGEVYITSYSKGYHGDPELTKNRFVQAIEMGADVGKTVFRTGDIGRLIPDPSGSQQLVLQLLGRTDRHLTVNGTRIFPEEIETAISHVPGVLEVAVVANGSSIVGFFTGNTTNLTQDIMDHCSLNLAAHMRPQKLVELKSLPKHFSGKIDLKALRDKAAEADTIIHSACFSGGHVLEPVPFQGSG